MIAAEGLQTDGHLSRKAAPPPPGGPALLSISDNFDDLETRLFGRGPGGSPIATVEDLYHTG